MVLHIQVLSRPPTMGDTKYLHRYIPCLSSFKKPEVGLRMSRLKKKIFSLSNKDQSKSYSQTWISDVSNTSAPLLVELDSISSFYTFFFFK